MKLNKKLFYFSIIVSIFILIITIYLNFHLKYSDIAQYISNILLNILSGLIVLIVTSLFDYFIKRRECLEKIMLQCQYLALEFDKIKYFEEKTVDGMLEANKKDSKISSEDEEDIKEYVETENVKNLENIMDEYIKLSESNLNEFWNLYRDLDFLFDIKEKKKVSFVTCLSNSILNTIKILFLLYGIITFFMVITSLIKANFPFNNMINSIICGLLEMTQGIYFISSYNLNLIFKATIITFFISFGGLSIHMQVFSILSDYKLKYKDYLLARLMHALIASSLVFLILNFTL